MHEKEKGFLPTQQRPPPGVTNVGKQVRLALTAHNFPEGLAVGAMHLVKGCVLWSAVPVDSRLLDDSRLIYRLIVMQQI